MKINEKIKELRLSRGWSQTMLGEKFTPPITHQAISQIESGKFSPSFETLEELAKIFALENKYLQECG